MSKTEGDGGSILDARTTFEVIDENGDPTETITLFQKGYLSVYIHTNYSGEAFKTWMVKRNNSEEYDSLGYGSNVTGARNGEQKLELFSNGVYLIDEAFLDKYLQSTGEIIFKAVYTNTTPIKVTIEANQKTYGVVTVDGVPALFDENNKAVSTYAEGSEGSNTTIKITPNRYRAVDYVQVADSQHGPWNDLYEDVGKTNEYTIRVGSSTQVKIFYKSLTYNIKVTEKTTGEKDVLGGAVNTISGTIGLESPRNAFAFNLNAIEGYRLVSNSINNIKILNKQTGRYDYFSTNNGYINLPINEVFLDKYLKNGVEEEVEIIAIYVKQYELSIDIVNPEQGTVSITVEEPNGISYEYSKTIRYYDEGSIITIVAVAENGSTIIDKVDIGSDEEYYGYMFILSLNEDRAIVITFGKQHYTLNAKAENERNEVINSISVDSTKTELDLGQSFTATKGQPVDYGFIGWYIKIGSDYILYSDVNGNLLDIEVNETFVQNYADGFEINLVARFEVRYIADISKTAGGVINSIVILDGSKATVDGIDNMYKENSVLKINFTANDFYYLESIDGLYGIEAIGDGYVIITVDGYRVITLNFAPEIFAVTSNNNLSGANGKINVLTQKMSVGEKVVVTFDVASGFEVTNWKINGMTISEINSRYSGAKAVRNGDTVTFTVTAGWLEDYGSKLNNTVTTTINSSYLMIIIVALVLIPLLLLGILLMLRANKKRKKAYAEAMVIRDQRTKGLNLGSMVDQLRKGTYKDPSEEGKK